jgi:hypothetical protein
MNKELKKGLRLLKQAERLHPFKPDEGKAKIYDMPHETLMMRELYPVYDAELSKARAALHVLLEKEYDA